MVREFDGFTMEDEIIGEWHFVRSKIKTNGLHGKTYKARMGRSRMIAPWQSAWESKLFVVVLQADGDGEVEIPCPINDWKTAKKP